MSILATAVEGYDLPLVLGSLLVIIVAARIAAELSERIGIPPVLGEIVAGILIGPSVLEWVDPISHSSVADMIVLLGEIGVILLLLQVGLEMDLGELRRVGKNAMVVAAIGVCLPFAGGFAVTSAFGETGKIALFIGAALTATSVGITARVLGDLRALTMTESRVILGAAVADDVLGLVILTVVVKIVTEGSIDTGVVAETIGLAVGFLIVTGVLAIFVIPKLLDRIHQFSRSSTTVVGAGFALTISLALLANQAKLAFIIGAFMAGIGIGRSSQHTTIANGLDPLGRIFIPVFFASIGINADLSSMFDRDVLSLAGCLTVVAIAGKLATGFGIKGPTIDRLVIGIGMIPRGEVGLIFASIGLSRGILSDELYGAVLIMVLATTLVTPPLLTRRINKVSHVVRNPPDERGRRNEVSPRQGWLTIPNGSIVLHGEPPAALLIPLALRAAELCAHARPSDELIGWFGSHHVENVSWTPTDTERLIDLLRDGTSDSWTFLETIGLFEEFLPEVADMLRRRRSDPDSLNSLHPLRLDLVGRIHDLVASPGQDPGFDARYSHLEQPDLLIYCAFLLDTCLDHTARTQLARRLGLVDTSTINAIFDTMDQMLDAARGPDPSPPNAVLSGRVPTAISAIAHVLAILDTDPSSPIRAALDLNVPRTS